jgi:two-component system cell cycle sensor histidine kinase/response regulator CckA
MHGDPVSSEVGARPLDGFGTLLSMHPDATFVWVLDSGVVQGNPRLSELTGFAPQEFVEGMQGIIHPDDARQVRAEFAAAVGGENRRFRTRGMRRGGGEFSVDVTAIPVLEGDTVTAVVGILRDMSELEDALRDSERSLGMLRIASRMVDFSGWYIEADTELLFTTDELSDVVGYDVQQGRHYREASEPLPEPQRTEAREALARGLRLGEPIDFTSVVPGADGSLRHLRTVGEAVRDVDGKVLRTQGAFYNVTDIVERDRDLQRMLKTFEQIESGIIFVDRDWRFTYVNGIGERYLQRPAASVVGRNLWETFPEAKHTEFGIAYRDAMENGVVRVARDYYPPLGTWIEAHAYPVADGLALQLHDVGTEEGERLLLQQTTERLQEQAALLDAARDAIMVRGLDNRIQFWNRGAEQMFGWSAEDAVGRSARDLLYRDPAAFDVSTAAVLRDGFWAGELEKVARDGRTVLLDCRWQLVRDAAGVPVSIFVVDSDITEFRKAELDRERVQRMESLGTLAGGMAHDLNNVLTPILVAAELLGADETDPDRAQLLASIVAGAQRGAEMIRSVLSFVRGDEGHRGVIDIGDLLRDFAASSRGTSSSSITVVDEIADDLPPIVGERTQLLQVLGNLASNAVDAMPHGGTLALTAGYDPARHEISVSVSDTGQGMDAATIQRIFDPFFTTKELGRGTGLGLATSLSIVQSHGGRLSVTSDQGAGSSFELRLPVSADTVGAAELVAAAPASAAVPAGDGRWVLVVDDEAEVRQIMRQTLVGNGYRVLVASDGTEAVDAISNSSIPIDAVITDLTMPDLDGAAVVAHIGRHRPELPVLVVSGLGAANDALPNGETARTRFLAKPFTAAQLLRSVGGILADAEGRA